MPQLKELKDLDGEYKITYQAQAPTIPNFMWVDHTIAEALIENGSLVGGDVGGSTWKANISVENCSTVMFTATVSLEKADSNTFLMDSAGIPTKSAQTYSGNLKMIDIDNELVIYGNVIHGVVTIKIQMKRI